MSKIKHPDLGPPSASSNDYEVGGATADQLFDQVVQEEPGKPTIMTVGDTAYQRRIEALIPKDSLLSPDETNKLAEVIQLGLVAQSRLEQKGPPLSYSESEELVKTAKAGLSARNSLVEANLRFATWVARESMNLPVFGYGKRKVQRGGKFQNLAVLSDEYTEYADRVQVANIGLIKAAEKYKPGKGASFTTFAMHIIVRDIQRLKASNGRNLHLPEDVRVEIDKVLMAEADLTQKLGRLPYPKEIANLLMIDPERVVFLFQTYNTALPIHLEDVGQANIGAQKEAGSEYPMEDSSEILTPSELIPLLAEENDVVSEVNQIMFELAIEEVLQTLSEREAGILTMVYGLTDGQPKTLNEVATVYGVTRERVRQLLSNALSKLRHAKVSRHLQSFIVRSNDHSYMREELILGGSKVGLGPSSPNLTNDLEAPSGISLNTGETWKAYPGEAWDTPVRKGIPGEEDYYEGEQLQINQDFQELMFSLNPYIFQMSFTVHVGSEASSTVLEIVNSELGNQINAVCLEAFWNDHLVNFIEKMTVRGYEEKIDIDRIVTTISALIEQYIKDGEKVNLVISEHYLGKLNGIGTNLSHGTIEVIGDVGDYTGAGVNGTAQIIINGDTGGLTGYGARGFAVISILGSVKERVGESAGADAHITVAGDASDGAGSKMTGSALLEVAGDVKAKLGQGLRGGASIRVGGDAGEDVGVDALNGSIEVQGKAGSIGVDARFRGQVKINTSQ